MARSPTASRGAGPRKPFAGPLPASSGGLTLQAEECQQGLDEQGLCGERGREHGSYSLSVCSACLGRRGSPAEAVEALFGGAPARLIPAAASDRCARMVLRAKDPEALSRSHGNGARGSTRPGRLAFEKYNL